jgi:8-oxo-dGTP pyrophosphatase MutT (NUDIX family)
MVCRHRRPGGLPYLTGLAKIAAMRHTAGLLDRLTLAFRIGDPYLVRGVIKKGVSKSLQLYWRQTRALTMGAQGMVLDADGRVLLIRHTYRPGWHFPGGGVEKGETIECSVTREVLEEAGIELTARPELFGVYANFKAFPSDHIALFIIRDWSQSAVPKPNSEIAEQCFVAPDKLPDGVVGAVRRRLDEVLGGGVRDEHW